MTPHVFSYSPAAYGLPTREELVEHRIWDLHFHGFNQMSAVMPFQDRFGVERLFTLGFGRIWGRTPAETAELETVARAELEKWKERVSGILIIDPGEPERSLELMKRWIENGPCVGIKYSGGNAAGITCAHPNNDAIIRYAAQLSAVIYIHTWIKVRETNEPRLRAPDPAISPNAGQTADAPLRRFPGSGTRPGESTPMDVALLAQRFPDVPLICGHQGGDWELGTRAVRAHENVFFEFSGGDPETGQVDLAVQELGIDRLVWGGHAPSRSLSNELAKVFSANLTAADRKKILGTNLRRLAAPILRRNGIAVVI